MYLFVSYTKHAHFLKENANCIEIPALINTLPFANEKPAYLD